MIVLLKLTPALLPYLYVDTCLCGYMRAIVHVPCGIYIACVCVCVHVCVDFSYVCAFACDVGACMCVRACVRLHSI